MPKNSLNVSLKGADDIFSTEESRQEQQREQVQQIPIGELFPFKNHPFKVLDDESMQRTVESVEQYGVLSPLIARPRPEGGYEIISGHRRQHAAQLAGLDALPVIVRNMDDDAAVLLMYDELELDKLGDRKTALFLIMSDTDSTFNFLISMIYTQLFNLLCDKADDQYGGKLPVHVRCLIDECANIGQIPQLEKLVATIRSREISACLVLQTRSQLKAIYKDNADTIVGNMDSQIFLGGSEPTTLKDLAEALGKETIDSYNNSDTRGNSPSYGTNYQKLGHDMPYLFVKSSVALNLS